MDRVKLTKEQYSKYNIEPCVLHDINLSTYIPEDITPITYARSLRRHYVEEALNWEGGNDQNNRIRTTVHKVRNFKICVDKPGKEAAPDYKGARNYLTGEKTNNINDMLPLILKDGEKYTKNLTFEEMFEKVEMMMTSNKMGLDLLGTLLYRSAYMLDHKLINGKIFYQPNKDTLKTLIEILPYIGDIPTDIFLYYLDVLGLNEDVKVYTLGRDKFQNCGRVNTLLTFCNLISVILNRISLAKFAGNFSRPPAGMSPIGKSDAMEAYPLLNKDFDYELFTVLNS